MVSLQQPATQAELVRAWQADEAEAWTEVVRTCKPLLLGVARRMLGNEQDAEEIVNDSLLGAHRALQTFRGDCQLTTWLVQIVRNKARNRYHYWRRRHRADWADLEDPGIAGQLADDRLTPRGAAELNEIAEACQRGLQELSPRHQSLLEHRARGLRYRDIGRRLGIGLGTVKSSIARARNQLREKAGLC